MGLRTNTAASGTKEVASYPCVIHGHEVLLIDTPGFDDTNMPDFEVLDRIGNFLKNQMAEGIQLTGLVYIHNITNNRWKGSNMKNLQMFRNLTGDAKMENVVLLTSFWDYPGDMREREQWERELRGSPSTAFGLLEYYKATYMRHYNSKSGVERVLMHLLQRSPIWTQLQDEIRSGKAILETRAGAEIDREIPKLTQQYQEGIAAAQLEYRRALKASKFLAVEHRVKPNGSLTIHRGQNDGGLSP
jgi:hypothetical protein